KALDGILEALRPWQLRVAQAGITAILAGEALVGDFERGRLNVIAAPPDLDLLLAELLGRLGLVESLERAVMPFVEPPGARDRNPHQVHLIERDPERADGALEDGRECD